MDMTDPILILAEIDAWHILLQTNLRYLKDEKTCKVIATKLGNMMSDTHATLVGIRRKDNYQYYCPDCVFKMPPNRSGVINCATCGTKLKLWNLDYGELKR